MKKRCYIAGAGEFYDDELPEQGDYVIAADGGYSALVSHGIIPDLVVGDFDSLGSIPDHPNVMQSNVEKDDTDMMIAVRQGLELGYTNFTINGGLGGRLDQTLANIQILVYLADNSANGVLVGQDIYVTAIKDSAIELMIDSKPCGTVSVFCHGYTAEGVTLKGLKYPLDNATLSNNYPIGVSNELTDKKAIISVRSGTLIIVYPNNIRQGEQK